MTDVQEPQTSLLSVEQPLTNGSASNEVRVSIVDGPQLNHKNSGTSSSRRPNHNRLKFSCSPRRLAIISIVCGYSCVGIKALLLAVKAEREGDQQQKRHLSRRSRCLSALSISLCVGTLMLLPLLLILLSYLLAVAE
ncbi:hypothetical protein XENTR_v10023719 [Xenopus tropicalis]|uniref:Transmembrane protein 265 n=1 Tax=Xenopus tropicalis TaxID=8364 RepID=A0A8J1IY89_XENTR|nr:transmembrane protein 265 [Xenopus tropicalis]KAE8578659.1 hypothetical protein XENTR_v10023719 [Xenopus tropicalis]|eukprot:XP_012826869.1 PREDICTED: transmembrane protein 265 [Xenopus tropicalis]